ncbi:BA3454 family stress response protein [Bacillus sp. V59.32b]|nr:BA3454 family stress response protein [Bacillus sp. V59.32b]
MVQVTVTIDYLGKSYQTNVIAKPEEAEDVIFCRALTQVKRQWTN